MLWMFWMAEDGQKHNNASMYWQADRHGDPEARVVASGRRPDE